MFLTNIMSDDDLFPGDGGGGPILIPLPNIVALIIVPMINFFSSIMGFDMTATIPDSRM